MGLVVNTNFTSLLAQKSLNNNTKSLETSLERLSTGYKINRSSDDASGMAISKIFEVQLSGINRASQNAQDGANVLLIAESSFNVITENLQRIRELAIQAGNSTNSNTEKTAIEREMRSRILDITTVAESTEFNGIKLLGASAPTASSGYKFTIGANSSDVIDVGSVLGNARSTALHSALVTNIGLTGFSNGDFETFINNLDTALSTVMSRRSRLGAMQNQLEQVVDNLQVRTINLSSAKSRLKDVNMADETADMTKYQILRNASISVLAQANNVPKLVLGLLQGG